MVKNNKKINKGNSKEKRNLKIVLVILITLFFVLTLILSLTIVSALTITDVKTNPEQIEPGKTADISIEIENNLNEDIENVNIVLDLTGNVPIAPYQGSSEETIEKIKRGDDEKITFSIIVLPEASPGVYKIPVKINYLLNNTLQQKTGTISVIVDSSPKIRFSVEGYLIKGQEGTVDIRIINEGLSDIKLVSIQASQLSSVGTINSPLYEYLGNIESDDFETVEYRIFVKDSSATSISIPIKINYKDFSNKDFSQDAVLNIKVYSKEEAQALGLIPKQSYTFYIAIALVLLAYFIYKLRKKAKKKKALGA